MRKLLVILTVALFLLPPLPTASQTPSTAVYNAGPGGGTDYPWSMFHHDSLRTGATPASAPGSAGLMWAYDTGTTIYSSPAVANGIVYIATFDAASNSGSLFAIDEYSGSLKWVFPTGAAIYASPAVANGIVYITSKDSFLYAINAATGQQQWRVSNIAPITSSPVVADGKVFYGTWFNRFWAELDAVDASTGTVLWRYNADDNVISMPSVHNGRVFFGQNGGYMVALNETNGAELWKVPTGGNVVITTAPAVAYGRVFVGTENKFTALDETSGATAWTFNTGGSNATSGAINNNIVYFGTGKGTVYAVDTTTGAEVWKYPSTGNLGSPFASSPALALGTNTLVIGAHDRYIYALDMTTGVRLWRYLTGAAVSSSPAIADGRVFVGSQDHKVYGLGPAAPALQATIVAGTPVLKPGEVSNLTITVTNGTSPQSAVTLTLSSSSGGGFMSPVEISPGVYASNYTAPLVTQQTAATLTVLASKSGYLDDSASVGLTLMPFPPLTVVVTPEPTSVAPGGDVVLMILVMNGSQPTPGASIFASSAEGSFSSVNDNGNGNYTLVYSAGLQNSNPTITVQASKPGFSTGQAEVTITVSGVVDLTTVKFYGVPLFAFLAGAFLLFFVAFLLMVAKRKVEPDHTSPYVPAYAWHPSVAGEALSGRFRGWLVMGLAAIAGS